MSLLKPIPARVLAVVVNNPVNEEPAKQPSPSPPPPPPPPPPPTQPPFPLPSNATKVEPPRGYVPGPPRPMGGPFAVPMMGPFIHPRVRAALLGGTPPPPPPIARSLDCHICGYKAPYPSKLRVHIDHHLKNRRFRCQKCPKAYVTKSELRRHMKRLNHTDVPISGYNRRNRRTFDARAAGWTCAVCESDRVVAPGGRGTKVSGSSGDLHPRRIVVDGESKSVCNACYVHYHRYKTLRPKPSGARANPSTGQRKPARVSDEMKEREKLLREMHGDKDYLFKCKCARRCVTLHSTKKVIDIDEKWVIDEEKLQELVSAHQIAEQLSKEKYVNVDSRGKARRPGPGGGQRKSPTFTAHVLNSRAAYSHLCEVAKQNILVYSNGFLHYKPVNGVPRVEIKKREYKVASDRVPFYQCCRRKCLLGVLPDYVASKRSDYETASQEGRSRLVQQIIEGDGRGPYRCVKSIKALLGCGEHVISAAFRTVMQDKAAGRSPHKNRGRTPVNRTPIEIEEKFNDHLFASTDAHQRDPQIRVLNSSYDSNKRLRAAFNEIHGLNISESTLRSIQKRVMAQNGIKRVERTDGFVEKFPEGDGPQFWHFQQQQQQQAEIDCRNPADGTPSIPAISFIPISSPRSSSTSSSKRRKIQKGEEGDHDDDEEEDGDEDLEDDEEDLEDDEEDLDGGEGDDEYDEEGEDDDVVMKVVDEDAKVEPQSSSPPPPPPPPLPPSGVPPPMGGVLPSPHVGHSGFPHLMRGAPPPTSSRIGPYPNQYLPFRPPFRPHQYQLPFPPHFLQPMPPFHMVNPRHMPQQHMPVVPPPAGNLSSTGDTPQKLPSSGNEVKVQEEKKVM